MLVVYGIMIFLLIALTINIIRINVVDGKRYAKQVLAQQTYDSQFIPYRRGDIVDKHGTILATSNRVYNLIFDCRVINSKKSAKEPTLKALEEKFGIDRQLMEDLLVGEDTKGSSYQILKKKIFREM